MSGGRKWDMTSTHSLEAGAEWFRKNADASVVLVIRGRDYALAVAPGVKAADAQIAVEEVLPGAVEVLEYRQREAQEAATRKRAAEIMGRRA